MAILGTYNKDPDEVIASGRWGIDWTPDLATGETILTLAVSVRDETDGSDVTSTLAPSGGNIVAGINTTQEVAAGTSGKTYRFIHRVTTSGGSTWEDSFIVNVLSN